jgi:hypothetical protein
MSVTTLLSAAPGAVIACPVCFGQNDSPMAWAMNMGIFVMLLIVGGVLVGFASFFVHLMRRARLADQALPAEVPDVGPAKRGDFGPRAVNVQGGTAEC